MQLLLATKGLTLTGITLCTTIHSPTPRTFALFDRYCGFDILTPQVNANPHPDPTPRGSHRLALCLPTLCMQPANGRENVLSPPSSWAASDMGVLLFGRVLILQRGRVVYSGDNGSALSEYFGRDELQVRMSVASRSNIWRNTSGAQGRGED